MALGDGIRRNIKTVDPAERAMLRDAIKELNNRHYPGNRGDMPPGGVSWWFKQDEIHQATHVHGGPEFLPWHRELTNRFEALIREINPQLSLHYWDFKEDPRALPDANLGGGNTGVLNLFDPIFMGSPGLPATQVANPEDRQIGDPWLTARFYDPLAGTSDHPPDRDVTGGSPADPPKFVTRPSTYPGPAPSPLILSGGVKFDTAKENEILSLVNYGPGAANNPDTSFDPGGFFRTAWEDVHNSAHVYFAAVNPHISFRDPFVYLLHSNVDRIFAMWQCDPAHPERLDPNRVYGSESNLDVDVFAAGIHSGQNLTHLVEPFSTGVGKFAVIRPWAAPENQGQPHDYHDLSVIAPPCYDTLPIVSIAPGGATITGTVTDMNRNPIVDASVLVGSTQLATDSHGFYTLKVAPGVYNITAVQSGFVPRHAAVTACATTHLDFRLEAAKAFTMSGKVTALKGGTSIPGAKVTVIQIDAGVPGIITTMTLSDGSYTLMFYPGSYDGRYGVTVTAPGFEDMSIVIDRIDNGATIPNQNFPLGRIGSLKGKVTDTAGTQLPGAGVLVGEGVPIPGQPNTFKFSTKTNSSGDYSIMIEPHGAYKAVAFQSGYQDSPPFDVTIILDDDPVPATQDFKLSQAKVGSITGTVQDADSGDPIDATVVAMGVDPPSDPVMTETDGEGDYTLSDLPEGRYQVSAGARRYSTGTQTAKLMAGQTVTVTFDLVSTRRQRV
jgi:hypothetical protein